MTGGLVPDHTTIARFRDRHEPALTKLFVAVLAVCLKAGLGDVSLVAIDGSKFACSASLRANRTLAQIEAELDEVTEEIEAELSRIAAQLLESARRADLDEEDLFGAQRARGELPQVVGLPKGLHGRARRRARLLAAKKRLDDAHQARLAGYRRKLALRTAKEAATGKKLRGRKPVEPQRNPKEKVNVTDPDSRIMKDPHGAFLQGYNAQAAAARDQLAVVAQAVNDENDTALLRPMLDATVANLHAAGCTAPVGQAVADCGYCTQAALEALTEADPPVLVSTTKEHKTRQQPTTGAGDPPAGLSLKQQMDWRLATPEGKASYARRGCTIEPVFGQHKHNKGMRRFFRAGLAAVNGEWSLMNTTANITRLYRRVRDEKAEAPWSTLGTIVAGPLFRPAPAT